MTTVDQKKIDILNEAREAHIRTLAYQEIQLDARLKEVDDLWKQLTLGAIEVKQRIAELDKMASIEQADVNAVVTQISKLRNILLPGSGNTGVNSALIVTRTINADKIRVGNITGAAAANTLL